MKASWMAAAAAAGLLLAAAPAEARTVKVPRDFRTIQAAVDAAAPGDTIDVGRGTYTEEVVIGKDLDLRGAGPGATTIRSPATLTSYGVHVPDGRAMTAIVRVGHGARTRISGLTVKGPIPCGVEVTGVQALQGATLALSDARVTDIRADASACAPGDAAGRAVVFGMPPHIVVDGEHGSPAYGRISNVEVERYQHAGVSVAGPGDGPTSEVTIAGNVIRGGWQIPSFQFGIDVEGALARVGDNRVDGNVCGGPFCGPDPINEAQGAGIAAVGATAGTRITGNRLTGNDTGVYQVAGPDCCRISDNRLLGNRYLGIVIQDGDGATSDNAVTGGQIGIAVVADAVDTTGLLRGDRIRSTTVAPVREIECCGFTATAIVKDAR
jgi:parallel beta-helix repeat protein